VVEVQAHPDDDERALVEALRRGEPEALPALVDRYGGRIYNFAARMCHSAEDAKDIMQDTFLATMRSVSGFRGEARLSTWLFRITANACRKMHRRGKYEPPTHLSLEELMPSEEEKAALASAAETPDAALVRTDRREVLEEGIAALAPGYRAVLILRDLEGLSTDETAHALGLTPMAVKVRLHRARLALRARLAAGRAVDGLS
jgi:RNA polymerase sigma-70 factor (ECF subfamily)